jgi:cytoskeletal protein CcmA (bactofilin family)
MSIFRPRGFDSLIGAGTKITGDITLARNGTFVIDGEVAAQVISTIPAEDGKVDTKTTLVVNGKLSAPSFDRALDVTVTNVIITGNLVCDVIRVEGTLAVKAGAKLIAKKILYRNLVIETSAVVHGQMFHLDHVSEGEQT